MTGQPEIQITLASPKGGIGKTMTTILLACEFAQRGYKVLINLLDAFLSQRPTFAAVATAGSLYEVENDKPAIKEARDQTNALAAEIISRINEAVQ